MAHAQKPDFVFRRNRRVHLNRRGASVQSPTGSRCVRISGSNAGYTMLRGSVKSTGYQFNSPVSPSLPLPCVTVCHHVSTELYVHCLSCHPRLYLSSTFIVTIKFECWGFCYMTNRNFRLSVKTESVMADCLYCSRKFRCLLATSVDQITFMQ